MVSAEYLYSYRTSFKFVLMSITKERFPVIAEYAAVRCLEALTKWDFGD